MALVLLGVRLAAAKVGDCGDAKTNRENAILNERDNMTTPGFDDAGGTTLCLEFDLDSRRAVLSDTDGDFLEAFEDGAAALIVEKCHQQPAHVWDCQTTGEIVLQTLESLGYLQQTGECPVPISGLLLRTHEIIREIVPASRRSEAISARF